ncbi:MAG: O-antigen ligase family protein [Erysipelotrichaceae bacterium]
MNKYYHSKVFKVFLTILIILQPIIELDYLMYDWLNGFGLPRFTTILRFVIFPLAILYGFYLYDREKKRTAILSLLYIASLIIYFYVHIVYTSGLISSMYLPDNFVFSLFYEAVYAITLVIPFFLIYLFYHVEFEDYHLEIICMGTSIVISLPIVISNLLVNSLSTYIGYTQASFLSWFANGYELFLPRELAGKFFFDEGNTIGIILFMVLPILYYFYFESKEIKKRILLMTVIFIQSMAMVILSTRVSTYGTILSPLVVIVIMLFCEFIMKNKKIVKTMIIFPTLLAILFTMVLPYTPMIQNQWVDEQSDSAVADDDHLLQEGMEEVLLMLENAEVKNADEMIVAFEKYGIEDNLISAIPTYYFMQWYPYTHDAYFWLDVLFNVPFYERVNGRQLQQLFVDYKLEAIDDSTTSLLGIGYSTIMSGSLLLEKDFYQQYYSFGVIGFVLMIMPWIVLLGYGVIMVLSHVKYYFKADILVLAFAFVCGLIGAYTSGHTLDQLIATTMMALIGAMLLRKIND